jgi:osmotically-inducible protein OsmY
MSEAESIIEKVRKALHSEARVDLLRHPLQLSWTDGDLTIEGEVADIAAKKLALERAAAVAGVSASVDRLRVTPAQPMGDDEIRDHVRDALVEEPALSTCAIEVQDKGQILPVRVTGWSPWMATCPAWDRSGWRACWRGGCRARAMS